MDLKARGWKIVAWIVVGQTPVVCSCDHSNEVHETGTAFRNTQNKLLMKGFCSMETGT
jgi:hypothetical protein